MEEHGKSYNIILQKHTYNCFKYFNRLFYKITYEKTLI